MNDKAELICNETVISEFRVARRFKTCYNDIISPKGQKRGKMR